MRELFLILKILPFWTVYNLLYSLLYLFTIINNIKQFLDLIHYELFPLKTAEVGEKYGGKETLTFHHLDTSTVHFYYL